MAPVPNYLTNGRKYTEAFGDRQLIAEILADAGINVPLESLQANQQWSLLYKQKYIKIQSLVENDRKDSDDILQNTKVFELLRKVESGQAGCDSLDIVCSELIEILDEHPYHSGCYHLLAVTCYLLNQYQQSLLLIQLGRNINEEEDIFDGNIYCTLIIIRVRTGIRKHSGATKSEWFIFYY